ncbi:hypothetical protein SAMN05443572_107115 [Myxococcus fulvus]|uniref:Uncharacterized protein n=1 Tax=Myxococcus fulvus TaxID=33 RepID=A0A511T735_MYXFU|nr:hypothetical protein [Myxococcus fulvus]GEN09980.1 hypothetical protein MFU01_50170 [Myxococcus fulvus]SEU25518.1 hypothetical protein SAMN05443572_107115 [Myxococcus fulvus]
MAPLRLERHLHGVHVVLHCEDDAEEQAEWVLGVLARLPPGGLLPGRTLRFGWSNLRLDPRGTSLVVTEPDFAGNPMTGWRDDITVTLRVQGRMLETTQTVGCDPLFPRYGDRVDALPGWEVSSRLAVARIRAPEATDSGWLIIPPGAATGQEPESLPLYALLHRRPALLSALALPVGWVAEFEDDALLGYGRPN